jgi:hypothetical protein
MWKSGDFTMDPLEREFGREGVQLASSTKLGKYSPGDTFYREKMFRTDGREIFGLINLIHRWSESDDGIQIGRFDQNLFESNIRVALEKIEVVGIDTRKYVKSDSQKHNCKFTTYMTEDVINDISTNAMQETPEVFCQ